MACDWGGNWKWAATAFLLWGKEETGVAAVFLAGGWEMEGILEGNILRRGGGRCRESKDPKDAANANPASLNH